MQKKGSDLILKLQQIEEDAKVSMKFKIEFDVLSKEETEKKLRIGLYKSKFGEFEENVESTKATICKFNQEIVKVGWPRGVTSIRWPRSTGVTSRRTRSSRLRRARATRPC